MDITFRENEMEFLRKLPVNSFNNIEISFNVVLFWVYTPKYQLF